MNFKPTLWKTIVSVFIGFIANYIFITSLTCKLGAYCSTYGRMLDNWFIFLGVALIIYIIWSLFQKNN